jgi:hypothetical protein
MKLLPFVIFDTEPVRLDRADDSRRKNCREANRARHTLCRKAGQVNTV